VGLPRSSLIKSKPADGTVVATPCALPKPPGAPVVRAVPRPGPAARFAPSLNPFATPTVGHRVVGPGRVPAVAAPVLAVPVAEPSAAHETFRTKADTIEVDVAVEGPGDGDAVPACDTRGPYASAPSATELVERAVARGPARMTWESIVLPADPILDEKRKPHVAERRARFTRVVKIAVGACVGMCVLALGVSALAGDASPSSVPAATSLGKTVPSRGIVPIEPLESTTHAKARRRTAPVVTTAAVARGKKRR
jgi:hypothetical protein